MNLSVKPVCKTRAIITGLSLIGAVYLTSGNCKKVLK
jgi:hypothetical protein